MWVSILQNGRKKDKDNSFDKINNLFKPTDKPALSSPFSRPNLLASSRVEERRTPFV